MDKEQTAMERLRLASDMSLRLYHRPLLLTDSGGKDSAVICKLAENAGIPFEIVHSHTTADAPETVYHVRLRAKEYELKGVSYTIHYPTYKGEPTSMWKLIPVKLMPPTRLVRYCCDVLKETTGRDRFIVTGVRWAESTARKNNRSSLEIIHTDRKKTLLLNNDNDEDRRLFETCTLKGKRVCNPIIDWQESDVWDYLTDQHVECNPLYCEGSRRVGCVGCPLATRVTRNKEFARWPKFPQMYINAFDRMIAERQRRGKMDGSWRMGTTGVDVFHWWMEDGVLPGQLDIDDIETEGAE